MAGSAPKTKEWIARENKHKPKGLHVIVGGVVQVSDADKAPVLTERTGRPKVLELELTITACKDPAIQVPVWKQASFHKEVKANQFERVQVMWGDFVVAAFPVIDDREHSALMDKQSQAQNAVAAKAKSAKPKKPAAKQAAAKKKAPKAVGGSAKKARKTKTAKKPAKKTAGKSGLKKLVRKLVKKLTPAKKKKR